MTGNDACAPSDGKTEYGFCIDVQGITDQEGTSVPVVSRVGLKPVVDLN